MTNNNTSVKTKSVKNQKRKKENEIISVNADLDTGLKQMYFSAYFESLIVITSHAERIRIIIDKKE